MSLDVRSILRGTIARTRYTFRFNGCRTAHRESIAEHSYFTSLYAMLVADWVQSSYDGLPIIDVSEVLRRTLLHDVEEVLTGDLPRPYKHGNGVEFHSMLEDTARKACREVTSSFTFDGTWAERYANIWERAKDDTVEGRIVSFADFLSAISFILQEIESGNRMMEHIHTVRNYLATFECPEYEFIGPLVRQIRDLVKEVMA